MMSMNRINYNVISREEFIAHGYNVTEHEVRALNDHYHDPKNRWALEKYNARGIGRNAKNYGQVDMYLWVNKERIIEEIGYDFTGCSIISFSASIFTEDVKGMMLEKAYSMTQKSLNEMVRKEDCEKCTLMILEAFISAYQNYYNRKNSKKEEYGLKIIDLDTMVPQECGKKREVIY